MLIEVKNMDLIKAISWREELHKRDSSGRFAKQVSKKAIRSGSKVVAKNGAEGKVVGSTDTHYTIEKADGKTSKVLKHNVLHADEHKELTETKKGGTGRAKKKSDSKTSEKPKKAPTGAGRGNKTKPAPVVSTSVPAKGTSKQGATKSTGKAEVKPKELASSTGGKASAPKTKASAPKTKATTPKKTAPKKGAGESASSKPAGNGKVVPKPRAKANATKGGAKGTTTAKAPVAKKDIRSEAQKNRTLAYDTGDKVGGARKDLHEAMFKEKPTMQNLANLEKESGAVAEKMVTKKNVIAPFSFEDEYKNGVELPTAILKKLLIDRIAPKPLENTPEGRKAYMTSIHTLQRHIAGAKTWDTMQNAVRELSDLGRKAQRGADSEARLARYAKLPNFDSTVINMEYYTNEIAEGKKAKAMIDFTPLGDKLEKFFTDFKSRESSLKTINKNMGEGWDKYLNPEAKAPTSKPKGGENKKWERKAEAKDLRTGGKAIKVEKPEELMKNFGVRGVEFGNWVNDASGKYHLQRCAEAFSDLANTMGIDDKDISLNGRLAIAFGARGKGGALAHYEPARKVINMTKYGGAGSLAHEWGHAMDNILHQYSHGGSEGLGLASEGRMGDKDPKLGALYNNLMDTIMKPAPGDAGAVKSIPVDTNEKRYGSYLPKRRQMVKEFGMEHALKHFQEEIHKKADHAIASVQEDRRGSYKTPEAKDKQIKKYNRERMRNLKELPHEIAYDHFRNTGEPVVGDLKVSTGNSEYYERMNDTDGSGKSYWGSREEMFARVFESFVQHKLDGKKQYNNYLVHGTRESDVKAMDAPFPIGKERTHMFKAMDNLLGYVSSKGTLKKALIMDLVKSLHTGVETKRSAYMVDWSKVNVPVDDVLYIPINRLRTPYQTVEATNWDKVQENVEKMVADVPLAPVVIGLDYDIHDGHHRFEASHLADFEHVPCIVKGGSDIDRIRALEAYKELWKGMHFDESKVKRDHTGKFTTVYHTTKDPHFKHDPEYRNSGQEWGAGLYTTPSEGVEYWNRALRDKTTGEGHQYVVPMDISEASLLHTHDMPDRATRAKAIMAHFGSGKDARIALEQEEKDSVNGETYGMRPHEIAEHRVFAKIGGYDGIIAHDEKEGHQVVLFDDAKVKYGDTMGIDDFLKKKRQGEL